MLSLRPLLLSSGLALLLGLSFLALAVLPGGFFPSFRSEALAENELAIVAQGKLKMHLTLAKSTAGMLIVVSLDVPEGRTIPEATIYTPVSWTLHEARGIPIRSIGIVTHLDRTSYVIPLCGKFEESKKRRSEQARYVTCRQAALRFSVPSVFPNVHLTHIGGTPLLLSTAILDLQTRAVTRSTHIISGELDISLLNEV